MTARPMIALPECDKVLLVQAELDGELDAAEAAVLAAHKTSCPVCQTAAADITRARAAIDRSLYRSAPEALRARILAELSAARDAEAPLPHRPATGVSRWWHRFVPRFSPGLGGVGLGGFGLGAACAAVIALFVMSSPDPGVTEQIVAGHVRAMQPGHLEDVESSDRHTVKPWFNGRLDFTPPVKDFAAEGFPLRGGRLDYLAGRPVAALVYQRDKHIIDLFVWPAKGDGSTPPQAAQHQAAQHHGYNVVHWVQDGMVFWAVSDVELAQLQSFAEIWRGSS
jgi:anti-sigma factor RsiW